MERLATYLGHLAIACSCIEYSCAHTLDSRTLKVRATRAPGGVPTPTLHVVEGKLDMVRIGALAIYLHYLAIACSRIKGRFPTRLILGKSGSIPGGAGLRVLKEELVLSDEIGYIFVRQN